MNKLKDKLPNANKWCHIYTDSDGVTNIHNTETNETFRIIPDTSALGLHIERHKDGALISRNSLDMDVLKVLADLAGSNQLIMNLENKGGEQLPPEPKNDYYDCYIMMHDVTKNTFVTTDKDYADSLYNSGDYVMRITHILNPPRTDTCNSECPYFGYQCNINQMFKECQKKKQ